MNPMMMSSGSGSQGQIPFQTPSGSQNTANGNQTAKSEDASSIQSPYNIPSVSLPKGGGAVKGMGEKFSVTPANGTATFSVPIKTSKGRDNSIDLSLEYNSGTGNGPFGLGWQVSNQSITRKTDKGLPKYLDQDESDVFLLSGLDDLVPKLVPGPDGIFINHISFRAERGREYEVKQYVPRVESGFLRIFRLTDIESGHVHWEVKTDSNVTTIFGENNDSRVFDPQEPSHVFEWLPSRTYDDKGSETVYEYKREDSAGVDSRSLPELHRPALDRTAALYPKRIKYGNSVSRISSNYQGKESTWMFEIVFDYGEHDKLSPRPIEEGCWEVRPDPFSTRRAGFEIRTYRLCHRVLMFHHFPDEPGVGGNCLVSSFNLRYQSNSYDKRSGYAALSMVKSVQQEHWKRDPHGGYNKQFLPPLEFTYTNADQAKYPKTISSSSLGNLPEGIGNSYQLVDLEGQGLPGVVLRINGNLQYMPNNGNGQFGTAETLDGNPSAVFKQGNEQWMDVAGGGKIELVSFDASAPGFYKRNSDASAGWDTFQPFESVPNLPWNDKNVKFLDLTGDGISDVVQVDDYHLKLYPGLGDFGFGQPSIVPPPQDKPNHCSRLLFWDGLEAIYTADMTGDGLSDLVRVRHCEVCYWPNIGYGKFGNKVIMDGAPVFDSPDQFDQAYLRLADTDGSGTTDILYLGAKTPAIYLNLAGNSLSSGHLISAFPGIDSATNVQVTDLLGRGTSCLVWSSSLPGDFGRQIRYLDLMEGGKPHVLSRIENNMGWETRITYESSTQFYARDKQAGRPWTSSLPFPVQCVAKSETVDRVGKNLFTTRYAYHDGFFDGVEREFRGFGMVESWDTESFSSLESRSENFSNISKYSNVPPALTRTWYCTGEYRDGELVQSYTDAPFWAGAGYPGGFIALDSSKLPSSITTRKRDIAYVSSHQERREACRALRGSMIRSEVFAIDGTELQGMPYLVKASSMHCEQRQPLGSNLHAVYFVRPRESIEAVYDRKLYQGHSRNKTDCFFDPRISHTLTLETDFYGNPLKSMAVSYGRQCDDPDERLQPGDRCAQRKSHAVLSTASTTNEFDDETTYLLPRPAGSMAYEIIHIDICRQVEACRGGHLGLVRLEDAIDMVHALSSGKYDVPFENFTGPYPSNSTVYRRLLKESQSIYRRDDLSGALPLGTIGRLALPWKNYQLALTDDQATRYVGSGKIGAETLEDILANDCCYARVPGRIGWWACSGEAYFSPSRDSTPEAELREARDNFFMMRRSRPQWDTPTQPAESTYTYDAYNLLLKEARDPYGNILTVGERNADPSLPLLRTGFDYRLLTPFLVMDANRNRSQVLFDIMGNVVASAVMGKPEEQVGDSLDDIRAVLDAGETEHFFQNPSTAAKKLIGGASSRTVYDYYSYYHTKNEDQPQPNWVSSLSRETHVSELSPGQDSRVFVTFSYSDGSGRPIQTKLQSEPGPLEGVPTTGVCDADNKSSLRWLTSSWVVLNNKNKPVRQYEQFFSTKHTFEDGAMFGVASTSLYDAIGRPVAVLSPDHTWTKVTFDPWKSESWDKNDTSLIKDPAADANVGSFFALLPRHDYLPTWYEERSAGECGSLQKEAANKAATSSGTPSTAYFDSLGRVCLSLELLRSPVTTHSPERPERDEILRQPSFLDVQGLPARLVDVLGRTTAKNIFCIKGSVLSETNMDSGTKWTLEDVSGKPILTWNARGQRFRTVYDRCRRVIGLHVKDLQSKELLVEYSVYGETRPDAEAHNARGRIVHGADQSGETDTPQYDFQGNLVLSTRRLAREYKKAIDWSCEPRPELEEEAFAERVQYDALNKPTHTVLPDGTTTVYQYNERGLATSVTTTGNSHNDRSEVIQDIEYDAKGQRTRVLQGNGVETQMTYDPLTFRILRIQALRRHKTGIGLTSDYESSLNSDTDMHTSDVSHRKRLTVRRLQDLRYTYDAVGNIVHVQDMASKVVFHGNNGGVGASQSFTYDSLYRLVEASGREHLGEMQAVSHNGTHDGWTKQYHSNDGKAMGRYVEIYSYNAANNFLAMKHVSLSGSGGSWTRRYHYMEESLVNPSETNNRLSRTEIGRTAEGYRYEGSEAQPGNMTSMGGISQMTYDYGERMASSADRGAGHDRDRGGETTYYRYDATGKRVRKVTERDSDKEAGESPAMTKETIYVGAAYESFRRYGGSLNLSLRVNSVIIAESGRQLVRIERRTAGGDSRLPALLHRYQLGNHQGSATVEVDQEGRIITYEEYTPYGVSSARTGLERTELPKRYRFLGKERDVETGLYHLGARYYAPWLGRFASADPKGSIDGSNLYQYCHGNPIMLADPGGAAAAPGGPPPSAAMGWTPDVIRARARDWIVFENLPSWVSGLREWRVYGRMAAGDFAHMMQNRLMAAGATAEDVAMVFERYLPNAATGGRKGSSFIDSMTFPKLKLAFEHKLMDFERYTTMSGTLDEAAVKAAFTGSDGILAQLDKHAANLAAKFGSGAAGYGKPQLAVTIRGVEEGSAGWTAMTNSINKIMAAAKQLDPIIVHANDAAIMASRSSLDSAAMAFIQKAGGLAKYIGPGAKVLGPLAIGATIAMLPSQARAATDSSQKMSRRTQAGFDFGAGVTSLATIPIAAKAAAITAAGGATAGVAAAVVVGAAAVGGASAGAALGGYVADKVEHSEFAQEHLGPTGAAVAGYGTGVLAGAAAGAAVGALVGSVLPVVGTAAGAVIGGAAGALGAEAKILIDKFWN